MALSSDTRPQITDRENPFFSNAETLFDWYVMKIVEERDRAAAAEETLVEAITTERDRAMLAEGGENPFLVAGEGSPEGAITSAIGTLYLRNDGGPGSVVYAKEAGAGNTGWGAIPSDSLVLHLAGAENIIGVKTIIGSKGITLETSDTNPSGQFRLYGTSTKTGLTSASSPQFLGKLIAGDPAYVGDVAHDWQNCLFLVNYLANGTPLSCGSVGFGDAIYANNTDTSRAQIETAGRPYALNVEAGSNALMATDTGTGGTVTYSATGLVDTGKAWTTNQWANRWVQVGTTPSTAVRGFVASNTATALVLNALGWCTTTAADVSQTAGATKPTNGSTYALTLSPATGLHSKVFSDGNGLYINRVAGAGTSSPLHYLKDSAGLTGSLILVEQDTVAFAGTGLLLNLGKSGGGAAFTGGLFIDMQAAGVSKASFTAQGVLRAANYDHRTAFSDVNVVIGNSEVYAGQTGTLSANRTATLPAANAVPAGRQLTVADESGTCKAGKTIVVTAAGSDTIDGQPTHTIAVPYGFRRFVSDGSTKWTLIGTNERSAFDIWHPGILTSTVADDSCAASTRSLTVATQFFVRVPLPRPITIANAIYEITTAAIANTHGYVAIYDTAGNMLVQSSDQSTPWQSTGAKTTAVAVTPPWTGPDSWCYCMFYCGTGSTAPVLRGGSAIALTITNTGLTAGTYRLGTLALADTATMPALTTGPFSGMGSTSVVPVVVFT